jgi:outer membrane protein assembly factor BamB
VKTTTKFAAARWLLLVMLASVACADDWPQLRGPNHNGISDETGLISDWPEAGPPVLWSRELGSGYSAFAVVGERAYTQYQTQFGQYMICLDAESGKTIWEHRYDWPYEGGGLYPGPRSTPTVTDRHVYFASVSGRITCLDADNGKPIWSANLVDEFKGEGIEFGYSASPLLIDGMMIVPVGGKGASVVALDAKTGVIRWKSGDDPASYSSVYPLSLGERTLVLAVLQNAMVLLDRRDGTVVWRQVLSHGYDEHATAPLYVEPHLCLTSAFRAGATQYALHDAPNDGQEDTIRVETTWFSQEMSNDVASSLLKTGFVYGFDLRDIQAKLHRPSRGTFRCLDWTTGKTKWSSEKIGQASAIAADGKLILFTDRGELVLLRESSEECIELARAGVFPDEICWTSLALSGGRLYLRSPARAVCIDLREVRENETRATVATTRVADIARAERWDLSQLVGGEREAPFDPPTSGELWLWFKASLVTFAIAAALHAASQLLRSSGRLTALILLFVAGAFAGPVGNRLQDDFLLTWPVCLFAAGQVAFDSVFWAEKQPNRALARWKSRGLIALFLAVCIGYGLLCQRLGMAMETVFLLGFVGAFPWMLFAGWRSATPTVRNWEHWIWLLAGFTLYYWSTAGFVWWRW